MSIDADTDPRRAPAIVHHILVVDDEADTALFLKSLLEKQGYNVTLAKDGGQAHSMFVMKKPDFVILDMMLPGETGFEVCERLKTLERNVPILALTAIDMDDARNLARRVGVDNYMTKPFDPDELLMQIKQTAEVVWLKSHASTEESVDDKPVRFACRCGKRFKVAQQHRGKTLTCPNCGEPVLVPRHN
ncbi:MAG: response regulator [Planctomycetaceae bacterium]|nr:response regulator [Planctomycetaceae bacterium]